MIAGASERAQAPALSSGGRGRDQAARAVWAAGTVIVAAALFIGYLCQSRTVSVGSDGASQALQAWDMLHGNPLLRGWYVTDVSFYSTELPQYALLELVRGLSPDLMHVGGAMTYTLLVLAAAFLARGRATGRAGLVRALSAGGIMLAPQLGGGTQTLVLSPDHTGTAVPVLLLWLLIDRAALVGRARWYVPAVVWLGLTLTALADAITLFVAIIPLALVTAIQLGRAVLRNREPLGGYRDQCALLAAAVLAVPAELAVTALIRASGGWRVNGLAAGLAAASQLAGNARLTGEGLLELFGADVFGAASTGSRLAVLFAVVHLAGVLLAAAGTIAAARQCLRRAAPVDLIAALLLTGIAVDVAAYLAGIQAVNISSTREIAPVLPFAAVLAGRLLGDRLLGDRPVAGRAAGRALRCGLAGALACYAAMLGYAAVQPPAPPQYADLAAWLPAHHLTAGLSGYHQANIVSLESGGTVTLRPVTVASGHLIGYAWNASTQWFDPRRHDATFLVLTGPGVPGSAGGSGITTAQAIATLGHPSRTYRYGEYRILVWPRGKNLLARLG